MDLLIKLCTFGLVLQTGLSLEQCGERFTDTSKPSRPKRIIGGRYSTINSWPWLVSFVGKHDHSLQYCSGSLIDPHWILTAAHCYLSGGYNFPVDFWTYIAGNHLLDEDDPHEQILEPAEVFIHPKYVPSDNYFPGDYDIALIRLRVPARMTPQVRTICLPNDSRSDDEELSHSVIGWGNVRDTQQYNRSRVLKELRVHIIPIEVCNGSQSYGGNITRRQFCAGHKGGGQDACSGDSGGPLQYSSTDGRWTIKGLVSWGRGCARDHLYGVYTDVKNLLPFIVKTMKGVTCGIRDIDGNRRPKRIVGGNTASAHSWPWAVNMVAKKDDLQKCAGSIIASNWILTAAHCFGGQGQRSEALQHEYHVGDHHLDKEEAGRQKVFPEQIYIHPGYIAPSFSDPGDFDVALVKLQYSVDWSESVAPVCLPNTPWPLNAAQCYVVGWGNVEDSYEYKRSKVLKELHVREVSRENCNSNESYAGKIPGNFFCAGFPKGGNDTCYGDSGGALQCDLGDGRWNVRGIISWGKGCARPHFVGVYSNVSKMMPFVNSVLSGPDSDIQPVLKMTVHDIAEHTKLDETVLCATNTFELMTLIHPRMISIDLVRTLALQPIDITLLSIASPWDAGLAFSWHDVCKSTTLETVVNKLTQIHWKYVANNNTLFKIAKQINVSTVEMASLLRKTVTSLLLLPELRQDEMRREVRERAKVEAAVNRRLETLVTQLTTVQPGCEFDLLKLRGALRKGPYDRVRNMNDRAMRKMISANHVQIFMEHVELRNVGLFFGVNTQTLKKLRVRKIVVSLLGFSLETLKGRYSTVYNKESVENTLTQVETYWNITTDRLTIMKFLTASRLMEDKYDCRNCHENLVDYVQNCEVVCVNILPCSVGTCNTNDIAGPCICESKTNNSRSAAIVRLPLVIGVSSGCLVALIIMVLACIICKHHRNMNATSKSNEDMESNNNMNQKDVSNNNVVFLPPSKDMNGKRGSYVALEAFDGGDKCNGAVRTSIL